MERNGFRAEVVCTANCANQIYDQHCHSYYEVLFVLEGSIMLNVEGAHILLERNSGIVIEPLKYHIVTGNNTSYHRLIILFEQDFVPLQIRQQFADNIRENFVFHSEKLTEIFRKYTMVLERKNMVYAPLLDAILTEAIYSLAVDKQGLSDCPGCKCSEKIKLIISVVDNSLDRDIKLEDIAAQLYMSESSICHLFKQEMNISLKQYILQKKITYAKSLLSQGVSPGDAAVACGYKNYASFYKMYMKITGRSPGKEN